MEGQMEELELNSIAEAHIYLEFVRQMKDQNTRKFLKQTKEISDKLENYTALHEQFYKLTLLNAGIVQGRRRPRITCKIQLSLSKLVRQRQEILQ